jgi:hypothetical protein
MTKFIFEMYGGLNPADLSKEQMAQVMGKWRGWFDAHKDNIVDGGNPFGPNAMSVTADGVKPITPDMWPAKGYTIMHAADMDAAVKIAQACPILEEGNNATVRVYEAMPM